MASEQAFNSDLRSEAQDFKREKTARVKWAYGKAFGPGRREEDGRPRPAKLATLPKSAWGPPGMHKNRTAIKNDIAYASGDSSADEEVEHPSVAPMPDAGVTYSFDAVQGPNHGSQVLGQALDKAIETFEVRQTDKLIKDEYEVLRLDEDALSPGPRAVRKGVAPEDEDYEFVEA